jgi:hypothetical protein
LATMLSDSTPPGAGIGIWNLGIPVPLPACMSYIRARGSTRPGAGIGIWNLGIPELVRPPDLLTLRIRNSEACVQIPDSNPILGIWELGRWGSTWNLTEALGFQFRNSENEITVPLLHCRYTSGVSELTHTLSVTNGFLVPSTRPQSQQRH